MLGSSWQNLTRQPCVAMTQRSLSHTSTDNSYRVIYRVKHADTLLLVCVLQGDFAKNVYHGLCGGYVRCSQCSHKNWSNQLECFTRGGGLPPAHAETGGSRQRESGRMATCFITFTPFPSATTNIKDCEGNHGSSCWRQCGIRSHPLWWRRQFGVGSQSQRLISATRCKCLRMNIRGY